READRPSRVAVVHGVATDPGRIGRFHHDVAGQVGYLATVVTDAKMFMEKCPVQADARAVHAAEGAYFGEDPGNNAPVRAAGAGQQGRRGLAFVAFFDMRITIEPFLAGVRARLDLDQSNVQPGIPIRGEGQRAGDVNGADRVG